MRMTKQKKTMHDALSSFTSFFDAYELHAKVSKKDKKIGIATIYRFLNSLEESGEVHSFLCDNKRIYSIGKKNHAHFKCENCGKVKHVDIKKADFLSGLVNDKVCHFQIDLVGVCSDCKDK